MRKLPSGTVTFLFTDIEGSTRLLDELGPEAYAQALAEHRRVLRDAFTAHGGVEVDTQGDAFFVAFPTADGAVGAAAQAQAALRIPVRMGIHTGTPLLAQEGYVGVDVHRAARIAAAGHGGQVLVSASTRALADNAQLRDLGEHRFKDLAAAEPVFQLGNRDFPPLKTISNTNLPRPASSFVGRGAELTELLARIASGARLVTLTGPGGSGKTRLAIEAAHSLIPEYAAGVFWVGLAPVRDPDLVMETIAQTLGTNGRLAQEIADRKMLLLLDNLEQVIESAGELSRLLSTCPNLTLLITSRELLRVTGEVEFAVAPLTEPEGVALFCERAQLEPTDAIVELCRRLDSLPLALELAAARTKALSPAQIVDRLSQRLDLLKAGRDVDPRQQTLRAAIAWSYELLSDEERRLFAHLGVFAGGWTLEPAETVCGAEVEILESLATKSLVRYDNGRYRMLELIRGYAAERLAESGDRESVQDAHAEWVTNLASEADVALRCAAQTGWLERVSVEHDNVRAALAHRLERDAPAAARLAAALAWFWQLRSYLGEGEAWLARVFAAAPQADTEVRAALLQGRGQLAYYREEYGTATQLLEESASAWRGVGNERRLAEALTYLGLARSLGADAERTRQTLDDAVAVARRSAESWTLGLALWALGTSVMFGRCASTHDGEARTCLEESVDHLRVAGDAWALGGPLYYLGWIELQAGNTTAARPFFEEARALFVAVGDKYRLLRALQRLTEIARAEGDERLAQQLQHERDRCAGEFGTLKLVTAVAS